jgi:hypothetical protein
MAQRRGLVEKVQRNATKNAANRTAATRETNDCWFLGDRSNKRVHARPNIKTNAVAVNGVNGEVCIKAYFGLAIVKCIND